jgi:predicted RNA methylase
MGASRDIFMPLADILKSMAIREDDVVADVGAGDGYYAALFSKRCSKVYAIEVDKSAAALITAKKLNGVVVLNMDICQGWPVDDATYAFFSNSFHDLDCKEKLIAEMSKRLVKPARIAMIEFKQDTPFGPPASIRLSTDELDKLMKRGEFHLMGRQDFRFHYLSVYSRMPITPM